MLIGLVDHHNSKLAIPWKHNMRCNVSSALRSLFVLGLRDEYVNDVFLREAEISAISSQQWWLNFPIIFVAFICCLGQYIGISKCTMLPPNLPAVQHSRELAHCCIECNPLAPKIIQFSINVWDNIMISCPKLIDFGWGSCIPLSLSIVCASLPSIRSRMMPLTTLKWW